MSGKTVWLSGLAVALLGVGVARGQGPAVPGGGAGMWGADSGGPPSIPRVPAGGLVGEGPAWPPAYATAPPGSQGAAGGPPVVGPGLSSWLVYPRSPGCCGPLGKCGPIGAEIFLRSGLSFSVGDGFFGEGFDTGWAIEGGGRVLFFNPVVDAAWTLDLSVSNFHYNPNNRGQVATLRNIPQQVPGFFGGTTTEIIPEVNVTLRGLNLTFVNVAFGREWYLTGYADSGEPSWRAGVDFGGRYGSAKLDVNELRHRTDAVGGVFVAVHSDVELPCSCGCIFSAGVRGEYGYTWTDLLQRQNDADLQTINLLLTLGVRF